MQQARQALIARGENPSIDAIRIELGNTGSKTTIHRYLKELNGQQPVASEGGIALSDVLSRMVGQLATQLQDEADLKIEQAESAFTRQREQLEAQLAIAQQALAAAHQQHQIDVAALAAESEKLLSTQSTLQAEQLRSASLNQSLGELQVRLADKEEQVKSLEDKHRHARDALEHYRNASREQREQEQRRHEAQLQQLQVEVRQLQQGMIVKQDELTRLHRDNERLLGEHRQAASACRAQDELLEQRDAQIQGLRTILAQAQGASEEMRRQLDVQAQSLEARRDLCTEQARQLRQLEEQLKARDGSAAPVSVAVDCRQRGAVAAKRPYRRHGTILRQGPVGAGMPANTGGAGAIQRVGPFAGTPAPDRECDTLSNLVPYATAQPERAWANLPPGNATRARTLFPVRQGWAGGRSVFGLSGCLHTCRR
ncbi:Tn4652, cointegrate resolution protein T [Pseudomonas putida S11]|nr:Tn4652, cointegrate resolution protein T [Pseudomonas putida S11]